jgi:hypothetical protein
MWRMRAVAAAALAGTFMVVACLRSDAVYCPETGYYCPQGQACAKAPLWCGPPEQVARCADIDDWDPCEFSGTEKLFDGSCRSGVCEACTQDRAGCSHDDWRAMRSPVGEALRDVWIARKGEGYAVGDLGTTVRYDGVAWTRMAELETEAAGELIVAITGTVEPFSVYALTQSGKVFASGDRGRTWNDVSPPSTLPLLTLWSPSAAEVIGAGILGEIWHLEDDEWRLLPSMTSANFSALTGRSAAEVFAVGRIGEDALVRRWDGTQWTTMQTVSGVVFNDAWVTNEQLIAVGFHESSDANAVSRFDGTTWHNDDATATVVGRLQAAWGTNGADLFAAGEGGTIIRWVGSGWMRQRTPSQQLTIYGLSGSARDDVFAVGEGGLIWRYAGRDSPSP